MRINVTIHIEPDDPLAHSHIEIQRFAHGADDLISDTAGVAAAQALAAVLASRDAVSEYAE